MFRKKKKYDVIVIGGGHAGCEAAYAAAKMGSSTLLISMNLRKIATMPCNPSIGGPGKGHLVSEIAALGGVMPKIADKSLIQIRLLNTSKGPVVQSYRAQIEKDKYSKKMLSTLRKTKNLELLDDEVIDIKTKNNYVAYIKTEEGKIIETSSVIVSTGTFLNGRIYIGNKQVKKGGRIDIKASIKLSESLKSLGLKLGKLKTGTPPRVLKKSVNTSKMVKQPGIKGNHSFSFPRKKAISFKKQVSCFLTYTNKKTHKIILDHKQKSPVSSGVIKEEAPRHCPSLDRKVIKFPEKEKHPIFVEPIGKKSNKYYLQGCSMSFPEEIQQKILKSIKGLEKVKILEPGYAIVYNYSYPYQIKNNLETKKINNLFLAGQINGTSGYEEAASQGLMAGINASLKIKNKKSFVLKRNEAYIGVLIDDLITKRHKEPYRIYTGSAEFRLLLRQNTADIRLSKYGYRLTLLRKKELRRVEQKSKKIQEIINYLKIKRGKGKTLWSLLKQPEIKIDDFIKNEPRKSILKKSSNLLIKEAETEAKYEDYIKRQEKSIEKIKSLENEKLIAIDYDRVTTIRNLAKERLKEIEPSSIAQASRIAGVTPADITALLIYLKKNSRY